MMDTVSALVMQISFLNEDALNILRKPPVRTGLDWVADAHDHVEMDGSVHVREAGARLRGSQLTANIS